MPLIKVPSFYEDEKLKDKIPIPSTYAASTPVVMASYCGNGMSCMACMFSCQPGCQWNCEHACEDNCEWNCEFTWCGNGMSCMACMFSCQPGCQWNCEHACEDTCEWNCQFTCQKSCMACETACEDACLSSCQNCQTACEVATQADTTPPTISTTAYSTKVGSAYHIIANWSASDNVALSHFWAYRSGPDNTTLTSIGSNLPAGQRSYTFTTDGTGAAFQPGKRYLIRIRAIDTSGNLSTPVTAGDVYVDVVATRPANWNWEYNIASGGAFYSQSGKTAYLMRAIHWNEFTARVNDFRRYRGLGDYSFTIATSSLSSNGVTSCINQAILAINDMLATGKMSTSPSGATVAASIFINLRDKLNSIL